MLVLKACDNLDAAGWARLGAGLAAGDPDGAVNAAWQLKEITRDLFRARDVDHAREILDLLYAWADSGHVPEMRRFARTIARWEPEVLAYFTTGSALNGPTEAVNLLIKGTKRTGHGFRNSTTTDCASLCHCGVTWQDQPAARLRGALRDQQRLPGLYATKLQIDVDQLDDPVGPVRYCEPVTPQVTGSSGDGLPVLAPQPQ